jgi:hypothetical protein
MSMKASERVYTLSTAPEHPLARKYGISYARPGGLRVLMTGDDIEQAILGTRVAAITEA